MSDLDKRVQRDVFRIMRHKLKGKNSEVELKCWRIVKVASAISLRFGVLPYQIKLKHLMWYFDVVMFWDIEMPPSSQYRYYLAIKGFCECIEKWGHWKNILETRKPILN